jgi:type I restriction enzyme R subunit
LSQIITFKDVELEKWHVFLVALYKKLPYEIEELPYDVLSSVELDSYKVQYQYTRSLKLESGNANEKGLSPSDSHVTLEEIDFLSNIIKTLNDTYGIDLTNEDKVELYRMKDKLYSNEELMSFFNTNNTKDNIQDKFNEEIDNELLNFINNKLELYNKLTDDRANTVFKRMWFNEIYDNRVRGIL